MGRSFTGGTQDALRRRGRAQGDVADHGDGRGRKGAEEHASGKLTPGGSRRLGRLQRATTTTLASQVLHPHIGGSPESRVGRIEGGDDRQVALLVMNVRAKNFCLHSPPHPLSLKPQVPGFEPQVQDLLYRLNCPHPERLPHRSNAPSDYRRLLENGGRERSVYAVPP